VYGVTGLSPTSFLVGPEGGFSPKELSLMDEVSSNNNGSNSSSSGIQLVSLGPNILRAETAAVAALSCFMCWKETKSS